jgi:hypothetical protein
MRIWLPSLYLVLATVSIAAAVKTPASVPIAERTPAYFVDRYGTARSVRSVSHFAFLSPGVGALAVKGEFSVRDYHAENLRVRAVFHVPSLKLAEVTLQVGRTWTDEQLKAALAAYGADWRPDGRNFGQQRWTTPDGARAILLLTTLYIQAPGTVSAVEKVRLEAEAKRKAVPKF